MTKKVKGSDFMFCMHCGKQLEDGSRFCMYCGNAIEAAPEPRAAEPAPAAQPVVTSPEPPERCCPDPVPEYIPEPAPIPRDANVYSDPVPPAAPKKKKGKKTGALIAIILVLLLLIGGGVGIYLYTQQVYEENLAAYDAAQLLLDKGDYDGALEGFLALGDFEDAADRADELEELQKDYNEAKALLEEYKFSDAYNAFKALGDYRDSKNYVDSEITYQEALYLMDTAGDSVDIYQTAADYFLSLEGYADSAGLASECLLNAALIQLRYENFDEAMAYMDRLDPADAGTLQDAYAEVCSDGAFLQDIAEAMVLWYDEEGKYSYGEEIELAWSMVEPYRSAYFDDPALADLLLDFEYALQVMSNALDDEESVGTWSQFYLGEYYMFTLADTLYYDYGVFADDMELQDTFVGISDWFYAYYTMESSLENWWANDASAEQMDDGHYYAAYTNDTGYSFELYAIIYFYDAYDNLLEVGEEMTIYVAKGATVYIPTIPTTISDADWSTWSMYWDFGNIS